MFRRGFKSWCEATSIQVRRNLGLEVAAPLPAELLAESLGAKIWSLDEISGLPADVKQRLRADHSDAWSAITLPAAKGHVIIYNPAHAPHRRASDLMHELGHLLLDHEPGNVFFGANGLALRTHNKEQEDEARWLSGCLLLNRECLFLVRRRGWTAPEACKYYCVSGEMLSYRLQISGVDRQFFRKGKAR
jgi:Zn-dependent peptidase ImmA (M78 family)